MNICGQDGGIAPVAPGPLCSIQFMKQDNHTQKQIPKKKKITASDYNFYDNSIL